MNTLSRLIGEARHLYATASTNSVVVQPAIPILYFGDSQAFAASPVKVITVGLNPSRIEFPEQDRFLRFPAAREVVSHDVSDAADAIVGGALDAYFREKPYCRWFNPSFEWLLKGLDVSYYGGRCGTALHTDIGSPLATDPTWSRLNDEQRGQLQASGVELWHRLVETLQPDAIIISVARWHLDTIQFMPLGPWSVI
ncbi:MAG: hypothetical protein M3R24_20975 [Chloroflexota bacterium]|nr:hypothetical protein [Chloroflexota bacterium]